MSIEYFSKLCSSDGKHHYDLELLQRWIPLLYNQNENFDLTYNYAQRKHWALPDFFSTLKLFQADGHDSRTLGTPSPFWRDQNEGLKISLNPPLHIEGVVCVRNMLVEIDELPVPQQLKLVGDSKLPYSSAVFSGNRSVHFVVCFDKPIKLITAQAIHQRICGVLDDLPDSTCRTNETTRVPGTLRWCNERWSIQKLHPDSPMQRISIETFKQWLLDNDAKFKSSKTYAAQQQKLLNTNAPKPAFATNDYSQKMIEAYAGQLDVSQKKCMACPACVAEGKDKAGSNLSVTRTPDKYLAFCHRGCGFGDIIKSMRSA